MGDQRAALPYPEQSIFDNAMESSRLQQLDLHRPHCTTLPSPASACGVSMSAALMGGADEASTLYTRVDGMLLQHGSIAAKGEVHPSERGEHRGDLGVPQWSAFEYRHGAPLQS